MIIIKNALIENITTF